MFLGLRLMALRIILFFSLWAYASPSYAWGLTLESKAQGLAHYILAVSDELNGDTAQAISEYQKSVNYNGQESAPRLKLGAYYLLHDEINKAAVQLKAVTRLDPEISQAHYLLALIYSSENKYDLAADEFETVLKTAAQNDPSNIEVYLNLGQLYYAQAKYTQAIDAFRQALTMDPDNAEALNSLGYSYADAGIHLDEAIAMIQKALRLDPSNGAYLDSLGWALYKKGKYQESLSVLKKAQNYITDDILTAHISEVNKALKK